MLYQTRQDVIQKLLSEASAADPRVAGSDGSSSGSSGGSAPERPSLLRQKCWNETEEYISDNLREVYDKLPTLEKQIWGKLIVMEGNRRTAKAYLRHPVITIDGSDTEFDGMRIGLSRFENVARQNVVYEIFNEMLQGVKVKIDPDGNIWAKRMSYSPVFLKPLYRNRPNDLFIIDQRPVKVFDIRRFKEILVYELRQPTPDRRKLEKCCLVCLKFSIDHYDLMRTPCWVVIIHLVAMELLNLVLPKDNEMSSPSSSFIAMAQRTSIIPPAMPSSNSRQPQQQQEYFQHDDGVSAGIVAVRSGGMPPGRAISRRGAGPCAYSSTSDLPQQRGPMISYPVPTPMPTPPRSYSGGNCSKSSTRGAVFKRIIRKEEEQRGPYGPTSQMHIMDAADARMGAPQPRPLGDRIYSSMFDLRQPPANAGSGGHGGMTANVPENWLFARNDHVAFNGARGIGERVRSMDALNQTALCNSNGIAKLFNQGMRQQPSCTELQQRHFGQHPQSMSRLNQIKKWRSQDSGLGSGSGSFGSK